MTKHIQQVVIELEDDLLHVNKEISTSRIDGRVNEYNHFIGVASAYNRCIEKLKTLLDVHQHPSNPA